MAALPAKAGGLKLLSMTARNGAVLAGVLLSVAMLLVCPGCRQDKQRGAGDVAFEVDKVYERGPLTVHVRLDKTTMTIAETVLLEFEAALRQGYEIQMPKVDQVLEENFGIVDWDPLGEKLDGEDNVVTTHRYRLEPFLSGDYEVPAFTFEFHDVNEPETTHELTSEPMAVEVTSLLDEQRAELVIEDIEGPVEMPKRASRGWIAVLAALAIAAVAVVGFVFRKKKTRALIRIFRPAHDLAYARLRALVTEDLVEAGRIKEFYERISSILRHYIEDRFELHAPERTTEEFLVELQSTNVLAPSDKEVLGEFLMHCDLVKFAKHDPTTEQIQRTFDLVKDFIERTRSDERTVDVTDQLEAEEDMGVGVT